MKIGRRTISAAKFKARCLALLDQVAAGHETIVVTKRGKAVAKLTSVESAEPKPLLGSVRYHGDIVSPVDEVWDAQR